MNRPELRWHAPIRLEDVPETGLHVDLVADPQVRANLAALAEVRELRRLTAAADVMRYRNGLRATGRINAAVGQTCVVTLEPMESAIDEAFDIVFLPAVPAAGADPGDGSADDAGEEPEALADGAADLGAIATDLLLLGIDPYPRKPDAVFAPPVDDRPADGPFAALAKLKPKSGSGP